MFDKISPDDLIFAFFPCTYFECQSQLWFSGNNYAQRNWNLEKKCENAIERHRMLNDFYQLLNKLVINCIRRKIKLVIENPYNQPHYLTTYWCLKPDLIDKDRTQNGDYYKKPTQYWFVNFKPKNNLVFEAIDYVEQKKINDLWGTKKEDVAERSMIHPQYADRFIRQYILDEEIWRGK